MILDDNLTFTKGTDNAVAVTKAISIGQADLEGDTKGLNSYAGLILNVSAAAPAASLGVTLETSDTENGTFETVTVYPAKSNLKAGDTVVNERLPFGVRNWVRLNFGTAVKVNAHLLQDTDKKYPMV